MQESEILYSRHERAGVAWAEITLNRAHKGNALTLSMLRELRDILTSIEKDLSQRVVVLRGNGRFFCTGGDIESWGSLTPRQMARDWILPGIEVFEQIASLPQPVIAAITGHALGGGLELALAADLRIATQSAKFGNPEVTLGMVAGWSGVRRLAETIGVARASHLTLLGAPISAEQALDWGLVTAVAEDQDALEAQLDAWLNKLLSNGPVAMSLTKTLLRSMRHDLRHQHAAAAAQASATDDCREGVQAFKEKRKPVFRNL